MVLQLLNLKTLGLLQCCNNGSNINLLKGKHTPTPHIPPPRHTQLDYLKAVLAKTEEGKTDSFQAVMRRVVVLETKPCAHHRLPQHAGLSPSPLTFSVFTDSVSLVGMLAVRRQKLLQSASQARYYTNCEVLLYYKNATILCRSKESLECQRIADDVKHFIRPPNRRKHMQFQSVLQLFGF